jgi:hypothetical protein
MSDQQPGEVRLVLDVDTVDLDISAGCTSRPAQQLDVVSQIVSLIAICKHHLSHNPPSDRIASMSGDLSSMTAPPFILSPVSLTEYPGRFASPRCLITL